MPRTLREKTEMFMEQTQKFRTLSMEDSGPAAQAMNEEMKLRKLFIEGSRRTKKGPVD